MAITILNNRAINRTDTASAGQNWTATSATASDFQVGGGVNTPAFLASATSSQSVSNGAINVVTLGNEIYDTGSMFANNRFTPTVAGTYVFYGSVRASGSSNTIQYCNVMIRKNNSAANADSYVAGGNEAGQDSAKANSMTASLTCSFAMNGSSDYVQLYGQTSGTSAVLSAPSNGTSSFFGGYKLII